MKRIIIMALAAMVWLGAISARAQQSMKADFTNLEWVKAQIILLKKQGFVITPKDAENFRKLDEFMAKIDPGNPGRSSAELARQLGSPSLPVLISRYIDVKKDKLSGEKLFALTAAMFGEDGAAKLKGFDAEAFYRRNDSAQMKILADAGRKEQKRMEAVIVKQEEVKKKISDLETARGALTQAVTADGKFPIKDVSEFFSQDAPHYVNQARQNGTYTDAAAHNFYGAYYGAKNTYEANAPVIEANKDVSPARLKALRAGLKQLGACIDY